jgi:hypothetical protein
MGHSGTWIVAAQDLNRNTASWPKLEPLVDAAGLAALRVSLDEKGRGTLLEKMVQQIIGNNNDPTLSGCVRSAVCPECLSTRG